MIHDHLYSCVTCGMTVRDVRDCPCPTPSDNGIQKCWPCKEKAEHERQEAKRNS